MRLIFVHGWSVTNTNTYAELPQALADAAGDYGLDLDIQHLFLGRYISFHDEVTLDDISRAMDRALRELPGNSDTEILPFSCITHSTGGPVVRHWADRFYGSRKLKQLPLNHLVMLAPANHGSALAALGKSRVGRLKAWFQGMEPGQRVLDWLSLGSNGQWELNSNYLKYNYADNGFYPFVLTGQGIDRKFYDFLNGYLKEDGSDGVVRVSGANMNCRFFSLVQDRETVVRRQPLTFSMKPSGNVRKPKPVPLKVYDNRSHSGKKMGIMRSIVTGQPDQPVLVDILKCLQVQTATDYQARASELEQETVTQQAGEDRYCMLIFNIHDDQGEQIQSEEYDLYLLAGKRYLPQDMPKGFFKDKQMNEKSDCLVYYLDAAKMNEVRDGTFGIRVIARPSSGFSYYCAAEFRSEGLDLAKVIAPNQTTYVDIKLHRFVDENVFRFDPATGKRTNFKRIKPSGRPIDNH